MMLPMYVFIIIWQFKKLLILKVWEEFFRGTNGINKIKVVTDIVLLWIQAHRDGQIVTLMENFYFILMSACFKLSLSRVNYMF